MRQGQQSKRMRGRSRKGPNPLTRSYESNGPDVKIRGTALHIAEKYAQLARDAQASGDRVHSENLLQHAEHYFRIVAAAQAQMPQPQQTPRNEGDGGDEDEYRGNGQDRQQGRPDGQPNRQRDEQPAFGLSDPQPYVNGNGEDRSEDEAGDRAEENRPEQTAREQGDSGGGSRSRRRRPYRDRSADQNNQPPQATAAPQATATPQAAEEAAEASAGDD